MATSPRRNRVAPTGALIAVADRGTLTGNRGCLHDATGAIVRHHVGRRWIACLLEFRGRRRTIMQPGRWTELFFLDEATALAAGHRPCAECRRRDYERFRETWARAAGAPARIRADAMDAVIHGDRVAGRDAKVTHPAPWPALPDGTMVAGSGSDQFLLVLGPRFRPWTPGGHGAPMPRPTTGHAVVLTPRSIVAALAAGYRPGLHPTADVPDRR